MIVAQSKSPRENLVLYDSIGDLSDMRVPSSSPKHTYTCHSVWRTLKKPYFIYISSKTPTPHLPNPSSPHPSRLGEHILSPNSDVYIPTRL